MIKEFPDKAPCAAPTFYRTYSRVKEDGTKESYAEVVERTVNGLRELGGIEEQDLKAIAQSQLDVKVTTSGRWMWVGGTDWLNKPQNSAGVFNCFALYLDQKELFFLTLDLLGQGGGVGAVIERGGLDKLDPIKYRVKINSLSEDSIGCKYGTPFQLSPESTEIFDMDREDSLLIRSSTDQLLLVVGDSRLGWVDAYRKLWSVFDGTAVDNYGLPIEGRNYEVIVDYSFIRPEGTPIKGFGGKAQPSGFPIFMNRVAKILNESVDNDGRISTRNASLICCEAGKAIVAGGVRRCLPAGTKVLMADNNYKNIEDIKLGDIVVGPNGLRKVLNFFEQGRQPLYQVDTANGSFRCTGNHKVWVDTKQGPTWVEAKALTKGDLLVKKSDSYLPSSNIPVEKVFLTVYSAETYDIEVDVDHAFFADNFLVSNSAEWHGFDSSDVEGNSCKDNLWVEVDGKWSIDPERDAFRMANHTRIYHHRPTVDEIKESVTKQHASGEGAIMFAPESIARCNNDVLPSRLEKDNFIQAYVKDKDQAKQILTNLLPEANDSEIDHRMKRYNANPCFAPGTIILTKEGYYPIEDLLEKQVEVWDGDQWRKTEFKITGINREVHTITLSSGEQLQATTYHEFILEDGTRKQLKDLSVGDKLLTHDQIYDSDVYLTDNELVAELDRCWTKTRVCKSFPFHVLNWSKESRSRFLSLYLEYKFSVIEGKAVLSERPNILRGLQYLYRSLGINTRLEKVTDQALRRISYNGYNYQLVLNVDTPINEIVSIEKNPKPFDKVYCCTVPETHRMSTFSFITGQCVEILGKNLACNLSLVHLESIDPDDEKDIDEQFRLAALAAVPLLKYRFINEVLQKSRELDPIVAVCFTGLFDFLVARYKEPWLQWWMAGRPKNWRPLDKGSDTPYTREEQKGLSPDPSFSLACLYQYLSDFFLEEEARLFSNWKKVVADTVREYCEKEGLKTPNRVTAIQPSGCADKDVLRIFDDYIGYADDILSPGQGEVKGLDLSVRDGIKVTTGIANQPLNLVKITLKNKRQIRLTPDHRLSVSGNWVRADELMPGMKLDYSIGEYSSKQEAPLNAVDLSQYKMYNEELNIGEYKKGYLVPITMPGNMSPQLAYIIGALYGNGCSDKRKSTGRIRFSHQSLDVLNHIQDLSENLFGIRGTISSDSPNRHELALVNTALYDWFKVNNLLKPCKSKDLYRIPLVLRSSSRESILSFICGLIDTDGCVRESGAMSVDSASEKFIRSMQQIAEAVGLCFSISRNTKGSNFQCKKDIWSLCFSRMLSKPEAMEYLNANCLKCKDRPLKGPKFTFNFNPYEVEFIEYENTPDYSYDFGVEGVDDDDSWYWQGAIKSHNTKGLLSGGAPGWHPSYAQYYIRRITFGREDPVAMACMSYGYNIIPGVDSKKEDNSLYDDIWDPNVSTWLVEIPIKAPWSDVVDGEWPVEDAHVHSRWDLYMQVQKHYAEFNVSSTITFTAEEIDDLSQYVYDSIQNNDGYVSAALLAGEKYTFPRMPYEKITKEEYEKRMNTVMNNRVTDDFLSLLAGMTHEQSEGPGGCSSDKCEIAFRPKD